VCGVFDGLDKIPMWRHPFASHPTSAIDYPDPRTPQLSAPGAP
jgi:hypothetical protein